MALQRTLWQADDGTLFDTEADADVHDKKQGVLKDITNLDRFWTGKSPQEVVEWLMSNYEFTKKDTADTPGKVDPAAEAKPLTP